MAKQVAYAGGSKRKHWAKNVFFRAFKQKDLKRPRYHFCSDCLRQCWKTENSPKPYQ